MLTDFYLRTGFAVWFGLRPSPTGYLHHAGQDFRQSTTWCRIENRNLIGTVPETGDNHARK